MARLKVTNAYPDMVECPEGYRDTTEDEQYHYCKMYIPEIAGTYKGVLLICGGGRDMWDDYKRFNVICKDYDVMAVNIAGMVLPRVDHLFSLHYKQISAISKFRKAEYPGDNHIVHSHKKWEGIDYSWCVSMGASTSGFIAVTLGYLLGYRKMVLCGVPMDGSGYFYKPMVNETFADVHRQREVIRLKDKYGEITRSMSGHTGDILGRPDTTFIKE